MFLVVVVIVLDQESGNQVIIIDTVLLVMSHEMDMIGVGIMITEDGFLSPQAMSLR